MLVIDTHRPHDHHAADGAAGAPGDERLVLVVASDRISAYDHVLATPVPDKGRVATALSLWWFEQLADLVPNHLVSVDRPHVQLTGTSGDPVQVSRFS